MPFVTLDGIKTHYVKQGSGPFLLMMAPRGFESTLQSWDHGKWKDMNAIDALSRHFTIVAYDRREAGQSGGRVEVLTWKVFAQHAKLLLEHLDIEKAFVLGVCMGVGVATQFARIYPEACTGLVLAQPVGGHRWQVRTHAFFNRHLEFVCENSCLDLGPKSWWRWMSRAPSGLEMTPHTRPPARSNSESFCRAWNTGICIRHNRPTAICLNEFWRSKRQSKQQGFHRVHRYWARRCRQSSRPDVDAAYRAVKAQIGLSASAVPPRGAETRCAACRVSS